MLALLGALAATTPLQGVAEPAPATRSQVWTDGSVWLWEGERVTLLANTGVVWNEFPWFLIHYRDVQLGFMWGGILCSRGRQVTGTYQTCGRETAPAR